ncbi:hypothetical protein B0H15DRAFT_448339 [Mycena belliarum]|uniref:Uncharacterized protein n=1 Tax=Mycena belliarum TaxID=1033014 RepID=A0AAD6TYD9_9AGAR|nr:hypothetical protein B0H15DRAFT_448339 [Mycena belliae]
MHHASCPMRYIDANGARVSSQLSRLLAERCPGPHMYKSVTYRFLCQLLLPSRSSLAQAETYAKPVRQRPLQRRGSFRMHWHRTIISVPPMSTMPAIHPNPSLPSLSPGTPVEVRKIGLQGQSHRPRLLTAALPQALLVDLQSRSKSTVTGASGCVARDCNRRPPECPRASPWRRPHPAPPHARELHRRILLRRCARAASPVRSATTVSDSRRSRCVHVAFRSLTSARRDSPFQTHSAPRTLPTTPRSRRPQPPTADSRVIMPSVLPPTLSTRSGISSKRALRAVDGSDDHAGRGRGRGPWPRAHTTRRAPRSA